LDFQNQSAPDLAGVSTVARVNDLLVMRTRVLTGQSANLLFATNGPPEVSGYVAIVDNDLRGNTNPMIGGGGTCYYGGADRNFFAGNRCGRSTAWQIRIIFNNRSAFQHNIVEETAGAFEAIKYHCVGNASTVNQFSVLSDNHLAKSRLNVNSGAAEQGCIHRDSVFERNLVADVIQTDQPNNLYRHNVASSFIVSLRAFDANLTRGNQYVNNTCHGMTFLPQTCVRVFPGANADGTLVRNMLFSARSSSGTVILSHEGTGTVTQENNRIASGTSPFVSASPQLFRDFALPAGSTLIDAGKPGMGPSLDLLGNPAPRGAAPDIGAVEF
jgi:hypothetical protein